MADISKITLPSGTTYNLKDEQARNDITTLNNDITALNSVVSGGVAFIIAWNGTGTPVAGNIPAGVVVGETTGTLSPANATSGAFYLVKSSTTPDDEALDIYDEYVVIKPNTSDNSTWFWEKIGDTRVDLSDVVTDVTFVKMTDTVIGTDSTFTVTQPTIALGTVNIGSGESTSGAIQVLLGTGNSSTTITPQSVFNGYENPSTATVLTGVKVTSQPSVTLTANASTSTGRITYVESQGTATTTKLSATATNGAVSASGDNVTALTGLGSPSTKSAIGANATFTITQPTISLASNGSTATGRVQVGTGAGTASTNNTDWLKNVSVSNETLTIGAATLNTTYLGATASGANTAWNSKDSVSAVTGYANTTTDTVLGTASSFSVTNPSITISSGSTGDVTVATGIGNATTKYLSASASGTAVGANGTASAITGLGTASTTTVNDTVFSFNPSVGYIKATASNGNVAWNNKDTVTVLTQGSSIAPQYEYAPLPDIEMYPGSPGPQ